MKKIILTLALAAVAAIGAHAQIGVGVGYASTSLKGDNTTTNLGGLTFGATYNIPLVNGLAVAPGIQFAMQNYKEDANNYRKENYIAIPVMFNYGIELVDGIKVVPYLGPTLSYGISGVVKGGGSLFGLTLTTGEVNLYGDNSTYAPFDIL
ncbi:MAG: outer membrane beta-barrel protein, partial [Bacteroidales bacterium]|nr:outer membrane beta-barrel protein [Bacteroidales bacterium]